jgi:uncharacterized repeat protein (TIGR01451 family)
MIGGWEHMSSRGTGVARYQSARRGLTLSWLLLFIFSILLQYGALAGAKPVLAAAGLKAGTVQGFEIDGDLASGDAHLNPGTIPAALIDGTLTDGDDWFDGSSFVGVVDPATPPSSVLEHDKFNDTTDNAFGGGAKEDDTRTWPAFVNQKPTPKDDVRDAMAYAKFVGNNAFFYAGATRIVNNGDTVIDFELNHKPFKTYSDGISKPDRVVGDALISLEFSNGGSEPIVTVYKVTAVVNHPTGQETTFSADQATTAAVHSATNFGDLPDQGLGYAIPAFEFAETSVDLHALGIDTGCPGLANGHIRTRAGGDLASSQLKDTIAPFPIDLNNCGKLRIEKHAGTIDGALLGGATFTVEADPTPGSNAAKLTITDNGAGDTDPTDGVIVIDPAKPGTYKVCETVPPTGYNLASVPACQTGVVVPNNGSVTVKFADPRKTATTTLVVADADPADGSFVRAGDSISLTVTESNTGESILHDVHVTGTNSCASWTAAANKNNGDGAFSGTLDPGESVDFTCTFSAPNVDAFTWTATATGLDELDDAASTANETVTGSYDILQPATTLTVSQAAPAQVHEGDSVTIIVNEANSGEGTITNVQVDGLGECLGNWDASATKVGGGAFSGSLDEGESVDFTCTFSAPADDFTWAADGKGTDALAGAVPATNEHADGSVDVVSPATSLTLVSAPDKVHAGDTITVVVNEKNTGDGTLTDVHVEAGGDCAAFIPASVTLVSGASQDFTCTITTTAGDGTDKAWTADGKGTDSLDGAAPDSGEHQEGTVIVIAPATTLELVGAPTKVEHDSQVILNVNETNTGDDTLTAVNVTGTNSCADWVAAGSKNNGAGLFIGSLDPGESVYFSCTFTVGTGDVSWTALGHGTDSLGAAAPADGEDEAGDIDVINPATVLTFVSAIPNPVVAHGSTTITVNEENTGDSDLTNVNVTGSPCANWSPVDAGFDGTLAPTESEDFTCTVADVGTTNVAWSALGHGTDELENAAPADNEDQSGSVHVVNPNIDIVKTVGASLGDQAADGTVYETQDDANVVYKYVVTTQDPDGLTNVSVTDDKCAPVTAEETSGHNVGDTNADDTLQTGESWVFSCATNLAIADDGKTVHNIGTASGQPLVGDEVSSEDDADVTLLVPGISIVKTAGDAPDGGTYTTESFPDNVTYHYAIENTGELDLNDITVVDDNGTPANTADDIDVCTIASLAVGASTTCEVTLTIEHDTTNVAVATGHTDQKPGDDVSADDDAIVDIVGAAIQIIKTAGDAPDGGELVVEPGTDNVTYDYAVTNTGEVDLVDVHVVDDNGTPGDTSDDIDVCTIATLDVGQTANCSVTLTVLVSTTNVAVATGHSEQQPGVDVTDDDDAVVRVPALVIEKSFTGNTGGTAVNGLGIAKVGDTLTYTLGYDLSEGPVTNGVITDKLPVGLAYVDGSATDNDEFTFQGYDASTRTLTWTAPTVTEDGTVSYQVLVLDDSFSLPQPLENVATIDSDETAPSSDNEDVLVQIVAAATETPTITLPPTDTSPASDQGGGSAGFGLMLTLLILGGISLAAGYFTPTPGRTRRERLRRR